MSSNLADEPSSADAPQVPEQRWLGRWTFFCQWPHPSTRAEMSFMPLHKTWQMNLLWLMDPLGTRAEMPWIPVQKTWQINLLWLMDPPIAEERCLEYQYTKLGRWTYFGQWTPWYQSRDALNTSTHNLADERTLANGPPSTRVEMPWIPVHKTWQMKLLWPMDPLPPLPEKRCHEYQYTKLGRWTYFGQWTPWYQIRDNLHTSKQNLADEPTLADGPPGNRA